MTTTVTRISSDAKTALRNYFIDLIVATMAHPTMTTAATASSSIGNDDDNASNDYDGDANFQ
jgi:uncharacterized protein (DUF1800 family)